jgi:hypothetical protein
MPDWTTENWTAFHDHMPGKPRTLRVTGTVHAPTGGYEVELRLKQGAQGINPKDLLLELDVTAPQIGAPEVLTDYTAEYVKETDFEYDTVSVIGVVSIPVRDVE